MSRPPDRSLPSPIMWCSGWCTSTGCTATSHLSAPARTCTVRVCPATNWDCRSRRPAHSGRSPTRFSAAMRHRCPGWASARTSARTMWCTHTSGGSPPSKGAVHRQSSGEDAAVSHRATPRRQRASYPGIVKTTGMVNHFCVYAVERRLRAVFPQVLLLLSLRRQAVPRRP